MKTATRVAWVNEWVNEPPASIVFVIAGNRNSVGGCTIPWRRWGDNGGGMAAKRPDTARICIRAEHLVSIVDHIRILHSSEGIYALRHGLDRAGLFCGLATGFTIACYTLADGYSVKGLLLSPFLVEYTAEYRRYWKYVCSIAVLMPVGYILALFAMTMAPVPGEGHARRRIFGSAPIAIGVAAIAAG